MDKGTSQRTMVSVYLERRIRSEAETASGWPTHIKEFYVSEVGPGGADVSVLDELVTTFSLQGHVFPEKGRVNVSPVAPGKWLVQVPIIVAVAEEAS